MGVCVLGLLKKVEGRSEEGYVMSKDKRKKIF